MKKRILSALACFIAVGSFSQTAVDFTVTDCAGKAHNLFTELDTGNVVVLCWVMPCGSCIAGASTAASVVTSKANPKVVFYLLDDVGDATCNTITAWATKNKITINTAFDNKGNVVKMTDYGTEGMPKTVVLAGKDHKVVFNQNNGVTKGNIETAIDKAIEALGIEETGKVNMGLSAFPNPVSVTAMVNYTLKNPEVVTIEVMDGLGKKVSTIALGNQAAGKQEYQLNLESFNAGIYLVKLNAGKTSETIKLTVTK